MPRSEWRLRTSLALQLTLATLLTLCLAGGGLLLVRLPQINNENRLEVETQAYALANRLETLLNELESRLNLVADLAEKLPPQQAEKTLSKLVDNGKQLQAVFLIDAKGISTRGSAYPAKTPEELIGLDFSNSPLYHAVLEEKKAVWSDKYLSINSGDIVVGLGMPTSQGILIAEIPLAYLLHTARLSTGNTNISAWIIDQRGEVVADTENQLAAGVNNILREPIVTMAMQHRNLPDTFKFMGKQYHPASAHSHPLGWLILTKMPAKLDNPNIQSYVAAIVFLVVGTLLATLLFAPLWALEMTRSLKRIMEHARKLANNQAPPSWPRCRSLEINQLATDLERMSQNLRDRERQASAFFNTSPVAMMVLDLQDNATLIEVNSSWVRTFCWERKKVIGQPCATLGLWPNPDLAHDDLSKLQQDKGRLEIWLRDRNDHKLHCRINASALWQDGRQLLILAIEDITAQRALENALHNLNRDLEDRVQERTTALQSSNRELRSALETLRGAQEELLRAEKLSALGELVAGIAHELNTPIGNALMAGSTLADQTRIIGQQENLRRSELQNYMHDASHACEIIERNLNRAAQLVTSFKQVAADQTSSQRREFLLDTLINEILVTLHPTLKRTPYKVETDIEPGLQFDSFPGPLGQVLNNLINNAILHGMDERDHGRIEIQAQRAESGWVNLSISDDGVGIPPDIQKRIFNPFFTTRPNRGGTGLGLHIAHNVATQILGGSIHVQSTPNQGTTFTLRIPLIAPQINLSDES